MSPDHYYALALIMFVCGVIGITLRRNLIVIMMSIELLLNSVNLIFVAASKAHGLVDGQVMVLFIITIAACEAAVGLAMVIALYRRYGTIDTDFYRMLRG
ncbi:MAG: NADH-quinone oxidoreductase subunit NuoK [Pseudomonadota bacterium]|nr:NADH-quinone oxidoreductase subunit NuoK [Pseudomonadota bacterium]